MTKEEIKAIETHTEIHAKAEPRAIKITEILRKAVIELRENKHLKEEMEIMVNFCGACKKKYEEENNRLSKHILELQKDKGELTDKVKDLEWQLQEVAKDNDYYQAENKKLEEENEELKGLRCCENCKNVNLQLRWQESEEIDKRRQFVCGTCGNRKHWEYLGKTVGITETQQLTKAKELLTKWVELFKPKGGNIPPTPIQVDTEEFLKEIE